MEEAKLVTALEVFNWAVVRQSTLGPGVNVCALAFKTTPEHVRELVAKWIDTRGHMECVRHGHFWRIDAYYNTSGE